jgi:hypothetical protein
MRIRKYSVVPLLFFASLGAAAQKSIYDEQADAHQQVAGALAEASKAGKNVVLIFGANW